MLEVDLHQLRQRVEPGHAIVDLNDREAARLQHAAALLDQALRVSGVLDYAVGVNQIEPIVFERQLLAVGDRELSVKALLGEIGFRQLNRRIGDVDAGHHRAALREPGEIDSRATADFEHGPAAIAVEIDQPEQMMQFFEVILIKIVEEPTRANRMPRDLEIVNVPLPVGAHFVDGRHADNNIAGLRAPFMQRNLNQLTARTFDVLVVGGGIYGLTIAYDSAQRGLAVALIERHDFGCGASFNHLRTIHGGLRYLQTLDLSRARESVHERRTVARIAPDAVRPLRFVLPLTPSLAQGALAMRAGFILDRFVSRHRNDDVPERLQLPAGQVVPGAALNGLGGSKDPSPKHAATWYDYVTTDADRLTLSWGIAASNHGATLANYVDATELTLEGGRAIGARATDRLSGREVEIAARLVINATGGAVDRLLGASGLTSGVAMLKAMNLVTNRVEPRVALGGRGPSGRTLFMVPWKGRALFGTWESSRPCAPDDTSIGMEDVATFIAEINYAFPGIALTPRDVTLVHRGVVPAVVRADGRAALEGHEQVHDHADRGVEGLMTVAGTKYTTARAVAERVTNRILAKLAHSPVPCRTAETPLPFSTSPIDALLAQAARDEMVMTLEDAVVRRTPLGALGRPGNDALEHAAAIVGDTLGWDAARRRAEIDLVGRFYGTSNAWMT